ncbi:hypothetical protein AKAW_00864 [Aspergillus luchuensis IFO 4308]|nr:hypothetical protein AKAW_00864 [Aspergillus luchuensis IFO 4308]
MEGELDELRVMMKEPLTEEDRESAEMLRQNTAEINAKFAAAERTQQDLKVTMEQMHCKGLTSSVAPVKSQVLSPRSEEPGARDPKLGAAQAHVQEMENAHDQGSLDMRGPRYTSVLEQLEPHRRELLIEQSNIRSMGQDHGRRYGCDL